MRNTYDNVYYNINDARGVLRVDAPELSWKIMSNVVHALREGFPGLAGAKTRSDDDYVKRLLARVKSETIDHSRFIHKLVPRIEDLDQHLVDEVWKHVKSWFRRTLRFHVDKSCPISVMKEEEMHSGALGIFWPSKCEIWINKKVLSSMPYTLITLAHEYIHYVFYRVLPRPGYNICPMILSEGFSEYGCRLFYRETNYDIPHDMRKSLNENYELGRILVEHIIEKEGFGVEGFVKGFLYNISPNNPLKFLDYLFLM